MYVRVFGCPLAQVDFNLTKIKKDDEILKLMHRVCYRVQGKMATVKNNLREFSGFAFADPTEREKVEELLSRAYRATLNQLLDVFDLQRGSGDDGKKEAQVKRILAFLDCPTESGKKNMKEAEEAKKEAAAAKKERAKAKKDKLADKKEKDKLKAEKEKLKKEKEKIKALEAKLKAKVAKEKASGGTKRKATASPAKPKAAKKSKKEEPESEEEEEEEEEEPEEEEEEEEEKAKAVVDDDDDDDDDENGELTDAKIKAAVKAMLKNADLSAVSMKKVRQDLEAKFCCSLTEKKEVIKGFVNEFIEDS